MRKLSILIIIFIGLQACNFATSGNKIAIYPYPQSALLVMDVQTDFLGSNAKMPVDKNQVGSMIEKINAISNEFKAKGQSIIYIKNVFPKNDIANLFRNNAAVIGSSGVEIDPRIMQLSQVVFEKSQPDAFSNPEFEKYLISNQINELTICGVFADQCVYWTAVAALNRGYKLHYMLNGVAAKDNNDVTKAGKSIQAKGADVFVF